MRAVFKSILRKSREYVILKSGRKYLYSRYGGPVNALEEDWDNLIMLDACRYDTFAELSTLPGKLDWKLSTASATMEWVRKTIGDRQFHDTVYVTANPRINRCEGQFHKIIPVWKNEWDTELKVVTPDILTEITIDISEKYPKKRIITHFMQPHIPFIGGFGQSQIGIYDGTTKGVDRALGNEYSPNTEPYVLLEKGELDQEVIRKAYKENLQIVLDEVKKLLETLHGKSVVTADHGEMFGEIGWPSPFKIYGHKNRSPAKSLLKVPWLEYTNGDRREITGEVHPNSDQEIDDDKIEERLEYLGYR